MNKVLFVDNGVEFDSKTLREKPSGGAEVAFVSLVESLAKFGLEVTVYNNCINQGIIKDVMWKRLDHRIEKEEFDVIVVNRGDKFLNFRKECKKRIFWIHNPARYLLKYRYLSKLIFKNYKIVFSSNYHLKTYPSWAPSGERHVIPYGVDELCFKKSKKKIPNNNAIFTSNPMRGLEWVLDKWEHKIFPECKKSKLIIYSGFQTYGDFGKKHSNEISRILLKAKSLKKKGVIIKKPISRQKLFRQIKTSRVFIYQGSNDETFCMSVAESQTLGVPAVVFDLGCLKERVINKKTGFVCKNENDFCFNTIQLLNDNKLWSKMNKEALKRKDYFTWEEITKKWLKIIN